MGGVSMGQSGVADGDDDGSDIVCKSKDMEKEEMVR